MRVIGRTPMRVLDAKLLAEDSSLTRTGRRSQWQRYYDRIVGVEVLEMAKRAKPPQQLPCESIAHLWDTPRRAMRGTSALAKLSAATDANRNVEGGGVPRFADGSHGGRQSLTDVIELRPYQARFFIVPAWC